VGALCFSSCVTPFQLKDLSPSTVLTCKTEDLGFRWQRCLHSCFTAVVICLRASAFAAGSTMRVHAVYDDCLYRSDFPILL
jgi:hypothetical protein